MSIINYHSELNVKILILLIDSHERNRKEFGG